jgi:pyridoxamine 5'-phosphate oxidase family protein
MANSMFPDKEVGYIRSQHLARIATASSRAGQGDKFVQPDVVPVGFDFDGNYFYVGRMNILKSTKYKNVCRE